MAPKKGSIRNRAMLDAAKALYLRHGGEDHREIEKEMRAAGYLTFSRRYLMDRKVKGEHVDGWVARFKWKKELEKREKAKLRRAARRTGTFENFLKTHGDGMKWTARHHRLICDQLKRMTDGEVKRLMLFVPPRHGKSELVTVRYTAWRLVREPRMNAIVGCYNQALANRFSRKIRRATAGSAEMSRKLKAAAEWETAAGGGVKAVGVGAGITGFGGDLVVIDDPVKSRAEAMSRTLRDKTWDWYKDDISTRLEPGAAIILIQTRWHDDDLAGRLIKEMESGGEQWEVVSLPALAECPHAGNAGAPACMSAEHERSVCQCDAVDENAGSPPEGGRRAGEGACVPGGDGRGACVPGGYGRGECMPEGAALWPERFDREALLEIKRRLGAWSFAALYQQRPVPEGGTLFKREWFTRRAAKAPDGLKWVRGYDLAVSLKTSADYTASFRCALDERTGDLYIADGFRKRIEFPDQRRFVLERLAAEPEAAHGIESALHGMALVQDLRRDRRAAGRSLRSVKVDGDKLIRAEAWSGLAEEGKIVLVNGPWIDDFIDEVTRFTGRGDTHDDQVDAVSIAFRMLNRRKRAGHSFE